MAIHRPYDRPMFANGSVMTNGFSLNLAEGQIGVFDMGRVTTKGIVAVDSFIGADKEESHYEIKLGNGMKASRTNFTDSFSTFPFKLQDVVSLKVSVPKKTDISVDELVIGYDGINDETSLKLYKGENKELYIEFSGKLLEFLGVPDGVLGVHVPLLQDNATYKCKESCKDSECTCEEVDFLPVLNYAIEYINNYSFRGGIKISDFAEVSPIISHPDIKKGGEFVQVRYVLTVEDTGDSEALSSVQSFYGDNKIVRTSRNGNSSIYEVIYKGEDKGEVPAKPVDYTTSLPSIIKDCKSCPKGYSKVSGGFVYSVIMEDGGVNKATVVESLANAVAGTAVKAKGQDFGKGSYTVILSDKLSASDRKAFVADNPTAVVKFVEGVSDICIKKQVTSYSWVEAGRCTFDEQAYKIVLADTKCGESRLDELQEAYPDLDIVETGKKGGCNREYCTTVRTNVVCDECDPMYVDVFSSEKPASYDGAKWVKDEVAIDGKKGKYGIRIKGKVLKVATGECLRDQIGFVEDSVEIRATGGYVLDTDWSTGSRFVDSPFHVYYRSQYEPRTHVYGRMLQEEKASRAFFTGRSFDYDYVGRIFTGTESNIYDLNAQYADYALTLRRRVFSQALSKTNEEYITYHIIVPVGKHQAIEEVLNSLAAANHISGVKALPTA